MKKYLIITLMVFSTNAFANHVWVKLYPKTVKLLGPGLLLVSASPVESLENIPCATQKRGLYLRNTDPQFDRKLSMALSAQAQGKAIQVLVYQGATSDAACTTVSAHGSVATAYDYYWYLLD